MSATDRIPVDTNILVSRYDRRVPEKKKIASNILRDGIKAESVLIPHIVRDQNSTA